MGRLADLFHPQRYAPVLLITVSFYAVHNNHSNAEKTFHVHLACTHTSRAGHFHYSSILSMT